MKPRTTTTNDQGKPYYTHLDENRNPDVRLVRIIFFFHSERLDGKKNHVVAAIVPNGNIAKLPGGSIPFTVLSRFIATKWKCIPTSLRTLIEEQAVVVTDIYLQKVQQYKKKPVRH
jgi:hypothetical protein